MFEPDIKTDGRNSARVLAASLLSSAASRGLRAAQAQSRIRIPHPPSTHERMHLTPPQPSIPHHPIKQFMLSHHPVPHLPHKGFWPQYLYHRAEGKDVDKKFCFICQVIVNGAEPAFAVLVIFRVLFHSWQSGACTAPGSFAPPLIFKKDWFRGLSVPA